MVIGDIIVEKKNYNYKIVKNVAGWQGRRIMSGDRHFFGLRLIAVRYPCFNSVYEKDGNTFLYCKSLKNHNIVSKELTLLLAFVRVMA